MLYVRSSSGALVPLNAVATLSRAAGPVAVAHAGQLPAVTISFALPPGVSLEAAESEVQRLAIQTLPSGINTAFAGTAQVFQSTQAGLLALVVIAVFVIYVVLGVLKYELHCAIIDLVRFALRRVRGAVGAAHHQDGSEHLRLRWH